METISGRDALQSRSGSLYFHLPRAIGGLSQFDRTRIFEICPASGGSSSGVEHHVANVVVVGSNPISRSIIFPLLTGLAAYARARRVRDGGSSHPGR